MADEARRKRGIIAVAMAMILSSCDSAEHVALPEWHVVPEPLLAVGVREGSEAEMFGRVWDAARIPTNGVVVADVGAQELRFFGAKEGSIAVAGGEGEGPGEFRGLFGVELLSGDTVIAWDYRRGVISYWSPMGDFLDERPARYSTSHEGELLQDASVVVPRYPSFERPSSGRYRPPAVLVRHTPDGTQELGPFPYDEMLAGSRTGAPMPFYARSVVAAGGSPLRIVVADDTNVPAARVYGSDGQLIRMLELHDTREPVTAELWEAQLQVVRDAYAAFAGLEADIAVWGRPALTPAFDDLAVDPSGRVWALRQSEDGWHAIIHSEGGPIATVGIPGVHRILDIGRDVVIALKRDEMDVPSVVVFQVVTS